MLYLEKMAMRQITSANYITSVNGMIHPDRVLPEHDFLYMLDGEWEVFEDGSAYPIKKDDLLILTSRRHHYGEKLCNPGNRHMYFHVLPTKQETLWNGAKQEHGEADRRNDGRRMAETATLLHCEHRPQIRQYFQELISEYWSESTVRTDRLSLYFNLILCEVIAAQCQEEEEGKTEPMLEKAREQIQSNPQIFFTPQEMANRFFVCPRTLNNHFQKACGKTFSSYQMDLKLEMVREFLIHQPQAKLHEAAVNFGFYDEFHLSKSFRRKYGQSPTQYRKSMQGEGRR